MKFLVTGGAGFVGSNLCEHLMAYGHTVYCVDNFLTGRRENVAHLEGNELFHMVEADVTNGVDLDVDVIMHLSSPASPVDYRNESIKTMMANSEGTHKMLELARKTGAKFLLASTSEVYGDPLVHPQREDYWGNVNPNGPRACYDESKRFAEALTMEYFRVYNVDCRIMRIFNTYGPRLRPDDGRVVPNFINQALSGEPITIYGDGSQTRSFCYVGDLVEGIYRAGTSDEARGEVINLGNPAEYTMIEFAEIIKRLVGSNSEIVFRPLPTDDPTRRRPDISKAGRLLGWAPTVSVEVGMARTIDYFASLRDAKAIATTGAGRERANG